MLFLFGLFGGGDGFADAAGVVAVEGLCYGTTEGVGLEVAREHGGPGDGLEQSPMRAERGHEREDDKHFAESDEHRKSLFETEAKSTRAKSETYY